MVRDIITDKDTLHQVCKKSRDKKYLTQVYNDLFQTLLYHRHTLKDGAVGVACNQIGVTDVRMVVVRLKMSYFVLINPVITKTYGPLIRSTEGCLSCGETQYTVDRYPAIDLMYTNRKFKTLKMHLSGEDAIIVQHELAHLQGKLISDKENEAYEVVENGSTLLNKEE